MVKRKFCFLQGPVGPFFAELSQSLGRSGYDSVKVGLNGGDRFQWSKLQNYHAFTGNMNSWKSWFSGFLMAEHITDIVMFDDRRPYHAFAFEEAERLGLGIHVFAEGYLSPGFITYENGRVNGGSMVCDHTMKEIIDARVSTQFYEMPDKG